MSAMSTVVQQYALAYPDKRFTLLLDGRLGLQTSGSGDRREVMMELYGLDVARQLLDVDAHYGEGEEAIRIRGLISPPGLTRGSRSAMHLFVNRRAVQPRGALVMVVAEAYHTLLMKGRHPMVVLDIEVHPGAVDVNVHPTKAEVRFRFQSRVMGVLGRSIREALLEGAEVQPWDEAPASFEGVQRRFELRQAGQPASAPDQHEEPAAAWGVGANAWRTESRWDVGGQPAFEHSPEQSSTQSDPADRVPAEPASSDMPHAPAAPASEGASPVAAAPASEPARAALPPLRVVGQVGLTYIVAESPQGMYLIDQHAAHERITYERLMAQRNSGTVEAQELLLPQSVALPPAAAELLVYHADALHAWGFVLDAWGEGLVRVRAIPSTLPGEDVQAALLEIADHLSGKGGSTPVDWREEVLTTLSCHTSVRAGQALSLEEMRRLLQSLESCTSPRTCPHGRPTMVLLTPGQLERQFGRSV
jgi:DNA mismatch repair protein MutL